VNTVIQDRFSAHEIYYLGLSHTGMLRWEKNTNAFSLIQYPEAGSADTRWMIQRSDSTIWIGTKRWDYVRPGIFIYDLKQQKFSTTPASDLANEKFSSPFFDYGCFDNNGRFWIANSNEGIH